MNIGLYSDEGDTYIVNIINLKRRKALIELLTDYQGNIASGDVKIVRRNKLVSLIPLIDVSPKEIYHFTNPESNGLLKASEFVTSGSRLEGNTNHGFGSGIYGLYFKHPSRVKKYKLFSDQIVYKIMLKNPFIIQDQAHGESITVASMETDRFIDRIIEENAPEKIKTTDIDNLVVLWNIVLYRSNTFVPLSSDTLKNILSNYITTFFNDNSLKDTFLKDTKDGKVVHESPINSIFRHYNYDGLISNDPQTNNWTKGCISYNYSYTPIIIQSRGSRINSSTM